jgi:hypothetical protein
MKTKAMGLLVIIVLITTQCVAQKKITVEARNNDISNNLDLKAVATAFGESQNLEVFEQKLNDYDSGISNLDLNNDGQVDYLRVIEKMENNVHVVVIQAVLEKDVYQDVATIVVDRSQDNNATVQIIGDPYIYGQNYIIEPSYYYTPSIFSFFWGPNYLSWRSPYYWGYYPTYYRYRSPFETNIYLSNIYRHVNHDYRYYYSNSIRNQNALIIRNTISRNDYATIHPDRDFSNRNENVRNKRDFEFNRNGVTRPNYQSGSTENNHPTRSFDNSNQNRINQQNNLNQRNSNSRTYTTPTESRINDNYNRRSNNYQNGSNNNQSVNKSNNGMDNPGRNQTVTPPANNRNQEINSNANRNNYQPRPSVNKPAVATPKPTERHTNTPPPVVKESRRDTPRDNGDERK